MHLRKIKDKKAALELSIGTIVIIVIAMSMLILGIILVNKIFGGATDSVDTLNEKVRGEISNLFAEEGTKIAIRLGSDKTAKIKQGERLGIAIGAKVENPPVTSTNLKYSLEIMTNTDSGCMDEFKSYFKDYSFSTYESSPKTGFEDLDGSNAYSIIVFDIPKDARACEQRIRINLEDSSGSVTSPYSAVFRVEILESGIFS